MEISLRDSVISSRNTSLLSALPSAALSSILLSSGMAASLVTALPVVIMYALSERFIKSGLTAGGVKG